MVSFYCQKLNAELPSLSVILIMKIYRLVKILDMMIQYQLRFGIKYKNEGRQLIC
jgi:cytoplasmic iron level regulating protein YaaA (DUF328/UPF0246 family)